MRYLSSITVACLVPLYLPCVASAQSDSLAANQEIVRQIKDEPASLDPAQAVGLPEIPILRDLFEGLTNQDAQGHPVPGVAVSWHSSDQKVWLFTLRKDAKWSNGDPVTAKDFVYSWQRMVDPRTSSPYAWFPALAAIENAAEITAGKKPLASLGVVASDDYHLKVTLAHPVAWFPVLTSSFALYPVPQKVVAQYGNQWTLPGHLVGNGAYQLEKHIVNERVVLTRNNHYWDNAHSTLNKVTFVPLSDSVTATHWYQANNIDVTESFPKNRYQRLKQTMPGEVYTPAQLGTYYYAFNTHKGPTANVNVRKALSWTIDRHIIADKILRTGEKPAWYFTPDITQGFAPPTLAYQQLSQAERNRQAKLLLNAAGYGPSRPLKISILYNTSDSNKQIAIAVASMWKKNLGAEVSLVNQEWKTYIDSRKQGNFDVIRASWVGDYNEPSTFLSLLTSQHTGNISRFTNSAYDALMDKASRETTLAPREKIYTAAEQMIAENVPIAPIYQYTNGRLIKPWVKGYPITNPEDVAYSRQLRIEKH
ncbi:peptide ABC transporter substrate-binding protein [Rosenbergiella sp. S61]|uniref:Peptide ABC transporter substrate-binding protein n=1 Tax=Rosenbergiella gaditana TaxID=2726987 RepID=A0ABS5SUY1_9GAMM|nr:peptide ABC transporter substrate-binding protein [Rosenbergiella gaditana]MBT0723060.1 peptide ABC transporter substrate-binding protein [Rosenbergiella gaditana]